MCIRSEVQYYMRWQKFDLLKNLCTNSRLSPYPRSNPTIYWFRSRSLPIFTEMYYLWYEVKNGERFKKIPPLEYQYKHFNEASLAHWIMNDGYWDGTVIICTESFSKREVEQLIQQLRQKYGLKRGTKKRYERTEHQGNVRLRFSGTAKNMEKLISQVKPYMHPKMTYKFGPYKTKFDL